MDVMVFIHPGAFMYGSGRIYYPDNILQNDDIVYVSINYRLGVLVGKHAMLYYMSTYISMYKRAFIRFNI